MLVDRVMRSNAVFLVSGFRCECLLPNKEEKSEEAWEPVFSFGHFHQSVAERGVVCQTALKTSLFLSLNDVGFNDLGF